MEHTRQQLSEMLAEWEALIRTNLEEADAHHAKMETLRARLLAEMREDIKDNQAKMAARLENKLQASRDKPDADLAKEDADLAKAKVDARLQEMKEEMLAKMDANQKEVKQDNREKFDIPRDTLVSWRDAHQEATKACLGKTEARIKTGQEKVNTEIKTDLEDVKATDLEANPEETEAVVERQEIPNKEPQFIP
jgi:hypothetical protein